MITTAQALQIRNTKWTTNPAIPKWIDMQSVGLDQYFTVPKIAKHCYNNLLTHIKIDTKQSSCYTFLEPAAGTCAFYDLLPKHSRIGIDIMPLRRDIVAADFLSWQINKTDSRYITIGNPPFGYRAWLALAFMNHAALFSEYVGMILPMAFQSEGKGSPKHRVKGLSLLHSEPLPHDSFVDINGRVVKINALWQIWKRGSNRTKEMQTCSHWIELFTVDKRKERLCGQSKMHQADYFLQRTYYNHMPQLVTSFDAVKYACGYGIIIKKNKENITALLRNTNWNHYSNLATHNCRHISMYHIKNVLTDAGYTDD